MAEEYYGGARITNSSSNCKLSYVESINGLWYSLKGTEKENVEKAKRFLKGARIVVSINTIEPRIKDFFEKHFELYSIVKVPVGYNNGHQYHILIKNNDSTASNKMYLRPIEIVKAGKNPTIDKLEEVLTKTLKARRRKTDIVKEVMANIRG